MVGRSKGVAVKVVRGKKFVDADWITRIRTIGQRDGKGLIATGWDCRGDIADCVGAGNVCGNCPAVAAVAVKKRIISVPLKMKGEQ